MGENKNNLPAHNCTFSRVLVLFLLLSQITFGQAPSTDSLQKQPVKQQPAIKNDTISYSFYIKTILFNGHIYTSADTGIFDVTSNISKPPPWALSFKQDEINFFRDDQILQINVIRIGHPSSGFMQGRDISVWIKPKNQSASAMGLYSFTNQMELGRFKNGIKYIIDTLVYECADHYLKIDEMNKNIIGNICHVNSSQIVRAKAFFQHRNKIDSVLKNIDTELKADKKLAALNRGKTIETRWPKHSCADTITYNIAYWPEKHKFKQYDFDEGGNITRIITYVYPIKFFYKTCRWGERDNYHCEFHFVGRKQFVQVQVVKE